MPFYEYQCSNCGHEFEAMQKISEAPLRKCPSCGRNMLKKLLSAPVFRLKGSGWYETDFKSDQDRKRNLAGSDRESGDKSETSKGKEATDAGGKAEAKPETPAKSDTAAPSKPAEAPRAASTTTGEGTRAKTAQRSGAGSSSSRPARRPAAAKRARAPGGRGRAVKKRR